MGRGGTGFAELGGSVVERDFHYDRSFAGERANWNMIQSNYLQTEVESE